MEHAGVALRAVATIIDAVPLMAIAYLIAMFSGGITADGFEISGVPFLIWLVIAIAYYIVMEARFGAIIGKRLIALKVVMLDAGAPVDWQAAIVRNVLRVVDGLFFYLVGAIMVWTSGTKQRLGDRIAGTVVVRVPKA